nr:hypothetical protein [uncultured Rhodopila sp.]
MSYLIAGGAASALFVAAGWRSRQAVGRSAFHGRLGLGMHVALPDDVGYPAERGNGQRDDVSASVYIALARLSSVIASQSVKIDVAVRPGLRVLMRPATLVDTLEELLTVALQFAPASRMLLTAVADGDRVRINLTDDMPCGDATARLGRIRNLTARVAMRGDSLVLDVSPHEGTTMSLRVAGSFDFISQHPQFDTD